MSANGGFMLDKVSVFLRKDEKGLKKAPKHVAITTGSIHGWAKKNSATIEEAYKKSLAAIKSIISAQLKANIPIVTFYILPERLKRDADEFLRLTNEIGHFFNSITESETIKKNRIRISILGKWYSLPSKAVEAIKKVTNATKDYDNFFVNFCINYDGQEEIADACRLLAMHVKLGRLDPEAISKDLIKENLYSSYFPPPDFLIINDSEKRLTDLLLWDMPNSKVHFTNKALPDFSRKDFANAINEF